MDIYRINAIVAYKDESVTNYTTARDDVDHAISHTDVDITEKELFSWPDFRDFLTSKLSLVLTPPMVTVDHINNITWSISMHDGRKILGGFEAPGGAGVTKNVDYSVITFPNVANVINKYIT